MACPFRALTPLLPNRGDLYGLSFLLHPRFSGVWFFSFESMCDIVNLYSVRGRKRIFFYCSLKVSTLQFIPVRGRKHAVIRPSLLVTDCNLSPQGDGNPPRIGFWLRLIELQFIPARGQKSTSATGVCQQRRCFAFSYILFYRLGAAPAGIVFVTGSALTPCGTSGFMGRISCR